MKRRTFGIALSLCLFACNKEKQNEGIPASPQKNNIIPVMRYSGADYSQAISVSEANGMIGSYLSSINYTVNDTTLRSLSFDADTLRSYLNDTTHGKIVTLKFMLAHTPNYLANGNFGINAGINANAITLIIVGLDEQNNYVYNRENKVYDHLMPCPTNCGQSALLTITTD